MSDFEVPEEVSSPDLFSDIESTFSTNNSDESTQEPEPSDDIPEWKGVSMDEICKGLGVFDFQEQPPLCPSTKDTILIMLPLPARGPPKPYPDHQIDKWCQGYVRMPHSAHSLYPIEEEGGNHCYRNRWELIQESLLQSFCSSHQLERAILSYNQTYAQRWDFTALHHFFSEVVDEEESKVFFENLLPKIVQLALQLPVLITGAIPLLKRHTNGSITLSQLQVACLLANAFLCTFPRRNSSNPKSEYAAYPYINFNRLFSAFKEDRHNQCASVMEKLKCIFHYFRRVTSKAPEGVITIQRRYIPKEDCPKWEQIDKKLLSLHITNKGTIETEGAGLLQVDFANKYVGGGVLGLGCVQEEIRFVVCPELMVTMLVTEVLDDTEALVITGVERYSKYKGYSNHFKWVGDFVDETPRDSSGRRMTSIVAIDALYFKYPASQFSISNITRELNKAYVGFVGSEICKESLPPIATGNWGCGAFRGNPKLKVLLQLMAAAVAGRSVVYFTFGDAKLRDDIAEMYWHLVQQNINIARLFSLLSQYRETSSNAHLDFYQFLYRKSKIKPIISETNYFETKSETGRSTKKEIISSTYASKNDSQSVQNNNSRKLHFNINVNRENNTEEKKIEEWLTNFDDSVLDNIETKNEDITTNGNSIKANVSCSNERKTDDHDSTKVCQEKNKKVSLWELMGQQVPTGTFYDRKHSSLGASNGKKENIDNETEKSNVRDKTTNNAHPSASTENVQLSAHVMKCDNNAVNVEMRNNATPSLFQRNVPVKKNNQKKISDFFQRV